MLGVLRLDTLERVLHDCKIPKPKTLQHSAWGRSPEACSRPSEDQGWVQAGRFFDTFFKILDRIFKIQAS